VASPYGLFQVEREEHQWNGRAFHGKSGVSIMPVATAPTGTRSILEA
jgi:hypothetical protein